MFREKAVKSDFRPRKTERYIKFHVKLFKAFVYLKLTAVVLILFEIGIVFGLVES